MRGREFLRVCDISHTALQPGAEQARVRATNGGYFMAVIGLVEDEEVLRRALARTLQHRGHAVEAAASAEEGFELVARAEPDLVITDFRLPGMSGHELLVQIKRTSPELPVIMITAHGTNDDAQAALEEGAAGYLRKPIDLEALCGVINRCLESNAPEEREEAVGAGS